MESAPIGREELVWLLGSLCQINRLPWDPALALGRFPPPYALETLYEAAAEYGFRLGEASIATIDWKRVSFPVIAFRRAADNGSGTKPRGGSEAATALRPVLVVRADAKRLLYFEAGSQEPATLALDEVASAFAPPLLLVARDGPVDPGTEDETTERHEKFGYRWFANALLEHKRIWRDVLIASAAIQLVGLATPIFTQVVIDKVVVHRTYNTLGVVAVGLAMFVLFNAGMSWLRHYLVLHTGIRVDAVLGSEVFWRLLRLPLPYFEHRPTGTLVARLHAVETIREFISGASVSLLLDLPFLAIFLALMFWYSWPLTLIALGVLVLIAVLSALVTPLLRARINRQFLLGARAQAFVTEHLAGMETVKTLQMEPHLRGRYDEYFAAHLAAGFSTRQLANGFNVAANALEQIMAVAILCAGALLVMNNPGFTIGMLVAFQMFASRLSQPMLRLAGLWQELQQARIAMQRLGDIMDVRPEPHALTPTRAPQAAGKVEIAGLAFRYSPQHPYLFRDLTLTLAPGRVTVLTGPSGSGKSTLAKLLLGFYPPSDGTIRIDGLDVRHLAANELRQRFGVVPQETVLFSGTVYENLLAASPHASFGDVIEACKLAEIHDAIERLPQGYNTTLGEHGVGLSGGQKQRLAIARAILKRPRILVFDEATASLDAAAAERFAHTVNRFKERVTILFVTHQVPRGLHVDEIVSLGVDAPAPMRVVDDAAPKSAPGLG